MESIKIIILSTICLMFLITCHNFRNRDELRIHLIKKAITAIKQKDTSELYKIIDTSYIFDIQNREGLKSISVAINLQLMDCLPKYDEMRIQRKDQFEYTNYILPLCRNGNLLIFRFADYELVNKILYLELRLGNKEDLFKPPKLLN